jgi:hypothetical protein
MHNYRIDSVFTSHCPTPTIASNSAQAQMIGQTGGMGEFYIPLEARKVM